MIRAVVGRGLADPVDLVRLGAVEVAAAVRAQGEDKLAWLGHALHDSHLRVREMARQWGPSFMPRHPDNWRAALEHWETDFECGTCCCARWPGRPWPIRPPPARARPRSD